MQVLNSSKSPEGFGEPQGTDIDVLKEKIAKIDQEINELGIEYSEDELQIHIDKLHEYNEIKDIGQRLLGKIGKATCQDYRNALGWNFLAAMHFPRSNILQNFAY